MRALVILLILTLSTLGLRADESGEGADQVEAVDSSAQAVRPPVTPVEARSEDDSFLPTDRLRHDQEVDYPTDI